MKKLIILFLLFFLFIILFIFPLPNNIKDINSIYIYDKNNNLIYEETNNINKEWVSIDEINNDTLKALLFMEDNMFYKHSGFNIYRITKAFFNNTLKKQKIGASTITQQLAKNLFLTNEKTLKRKLLELRYSINLERKYCKNNILESYLNTIYFSNNIYGIKNACNYYFNKDVNELSLSEAISLFSITNNPKIYDPFKSYDRLMNKKNAILLKMKDKKIISNILYKKNCYNPIFKKLPKKINPSLNYFIDQIKLELNTLNINSNIKIYTDYDLNLSNFINALKLNDLEHAIIIANKLGNICAILGGNDYLNSINHIHSKRPIASLIKPFICYNALVHNIMPDKEFNTSKKDFIYNNEIYSPTNYNNQYKDYSNMAYSLSTSSNIFSCNLVEALGIKSLNSLLSKIKINTSDYFSISLGTNEDSLFNLVNAYSIIQNEGYNNNLSCIKKIYDLNNKLIYIKKNPQYTLNCEACKCIKSLLNLSFDTNIDYSTLKCINNSYTSNTMAKTGTDDYNSWIIGFSNNYIVGIWEGFDKYIEINNIDSKLIYKSIFEKLNDDAIPPKNKKIKIYNDYYNYVYYPNILPKIKGSIF